LQVLVGIADLTPDEQRSLMASLADPASWQRAGVTPPVPLSSMTLQLEGGGNTSRRNLRISSPEAAKGPVVDLLLNLGTSAGQRQVQISVMQSAGGFPGLTSQAQVGSGTKAARGSGRGAVGVRSGDTLYGIAQNNAVPDATIYQMLVALWRANPRAFIQNNMNLVKAGATLIIPDAATVRAIDPTEARRIFIEQQEAYARYRASLAGAAARGQAASGAASSTAGQVGAAPQGATPEPSAQDRVRLSSGEPGQGDAQAQEQARGDAQTSMGKATQDAQQRVDELERNVKDLNQALADARTAEQGRNASAGNGRAAEGNGQAGGSGLSVPGSAAGSSSAAGADTANQAAGGGAGQSGASSSGAAPQTATPEQGGSQAGAGAQGRGASPGVSGDASSLGGTSGQSGAPGSSASTAGGASAPGATAGGASGISPSGSGNPSAVPSGPSSGSSAAGASATQPQAGAAAGGSGAAAPAPDNAAADSATSSSDKQDTLSGLPSWLSDNLLIILTAVLALIAFVIAWLLRRAAARREEDQDDLDDELYMSHMDQGAIDRRLEGINLDLDEPAPGGEDRRRPGPVRT
jgi:pilus assembly protein FimV